MRRALLFACLAVFVTLGAASVRATPPADVAGATILAHGTATENLVLGNPVTKTVTRKVRLRVRGRTVFRRVRVTVDSVEPLIACTATQPCGTVVQQVTINPGGHTGWHSHPGVTFVSVAAGEGTLYHAGAAGAGCSGQKYPAGTGFVQSFKDVHSLRNEGAEPLVVHALYVVPPGTPDTALRTDQPQPPNCPDIP